MRYVGTVLQTCSIVYKLEDDENMNDEELYQVVDLMTPGCWAQQTEDDRVVAVLQVKTSDCYKYGFMFQEFWYLNQAEKARVLHIHQEVARLQSLLTKKTTTKGKV